ncbi:ATPase [Rhabdobacter roseus]|uniref:N-acetylglucosamine kinase-like BadF-type ATPase n=1 Tax=Rhabdobacter roseus TaxID=1655419 RepID=A0A840TFU4_9BACT|nr:N-acetylglucosamine kinase [Rhabdobacter roseus]MBB5282051.1 N-acetylglucosamine kinase-like BadF-type ATPase [Rhabdobacter roseus]
MMLLADSGSTKTDWLGYLPHAPLLRFQSSGLNPFYQTEATILEILRREVLPQVPARVEVLYFYGAGCADARSSLPVRQALASTFPALSTLEVHSDLLAAARALCGHEPGLACILGTGSNNALYDGTRIIHNIGSLGFWLGDEGSGGYLGKQLVVHYLHQELPDELQEAFRAAFPEINRLTVLEHAYRQPFPNRYFAAFSPFLGQHREHAFVRALIGRAFDLYLEKYVLRHPDAARYLVHFTGSVAYHYQELLAAAVAAKNLRLGTIQKSPMEGLLRFHIS